MFLTNSNNLAIIEGDVKISHRQMVAHAVTLASSLNIESGKTVAIFSENRRGWVYAFYATWLAKSIVVPIDFMATEKEVAYILTDCTPSIIFVSAKMRAALEVILKSINNTARIIIIDEFENQDILAPTEWPNFTPTHNDVAVIIYTSGTTGTPKGVMLTYNNLLSNILSVTVDVPILIPSDTTLVLLPLHHIFPLLGSMIVPIHLGGAMAFCATMNPEDILRTMSQNKVTIVIGVPRLYAAFRKGIMEKIKASFFANSLFKLAELVQLYSFSKTLFKTVHQKFGGHIRYMIAGGAALDINVGEDFKTLGFKILEGYGMTESAPMLAFTRPNNIIVGSVGKALPNVTIVIRDGEIIAKGPNIMKGYYNRPDETHEILKDGWLHTGDLGHLDACNNLYITGRKKEIIVLSNGKNINPLLIEQEIEEKYNSIKEIGLFVKEDQIHAIIVPNLLVCSQLGVIEIEEFIRHQIVEKYNNSVASYKKIFHFTLLSEELPRTRLGKIQRFKLALLEEFEADTETADEPDFAEINVIKDYLQNEKQITVKGKHHLELDLGLDSLEKVSFQAFLESTFGVKLEIGQIINFGNVLDLSNYIAIHRSKMEVEEINWAEILSQPVNLKLPNVWLSMHAVIAASKLIFKLYFNMKGSGNENIPSTPCIIVANHQSYFDGMILACYLSCSQVRRTLYYAKEKHVSMAWQKFVARKHNIIIMDKNKDLKESILMMAEGIKQGKNIVIFPEGTRTTTGRVGDFKKTYTILAAELGVPIVPAVIKGLFEALPKGSLMPKFNQSISIEFLKPISAIGRDYNEVNKEVRQCINDGLHR